MVLARTYLVLGLGASGEAACRLLLSEGHVVRAVDCSGDSAILARAERLRSAGVDVRLECRVDAQAAHGGLPEDAVAGIHEAIVSPGVPCDGPWVTALERLGIPVLSELELGWRRVACPVVAVTGSKGKSTLVKLLYDILAAAGKRVEAGGNYGTPLCAIAGRTRQLDAVVVEVSSFQLERASTFQPRVGILLNIQPDHLDRHDSMATYTALKARLFARMGRGDSAVVHADCLPAVRQSGSRPERWIAFGLDSPAEYRYVAGWAMRGNGKACSLEGTYFDNPITGLAAAAAVATADVLGIDNNTVTRAIRSFTPLPHRMQPVARIRDIRFVDDSKATNLAALVAGVTMTPGPIRLIAGGMLKEGQVDRVKDLLAKRVRAVYLIGRDSKLLEAAWSGAVRCVPCGSLESAVRAAFKESSTGETVLLSPGCASFDQFSGYAERGRQFAQWVEMLKNEEIQ